MIRQPPRHAARGGHHEDVDVAVVFAGEGDREPSGEKTGSVSTPGPAVSRLGFAAFARDAPQIARVGKHDLGAAERRFPQQQMSGLCAGERRQQEERKDAIRYINSSIARGRPWDGRDGYPKPACAFRRRRIVFISWTFISRLVSVLPFPRVSAQWPLAVLLGSGCLRKPPSRRAGSHAGGPADPLRDAGGRIGRRLPPHLRRSTFC